MVWYILAIICGILVAIPAGHSTVWSNIVLGVLVVIFVSLALIKFRKVS